MDNTILAPLKSRRFTPSEKSSGLLINDAFLHASRALAASSSEVLSLDGAAADRLPFVVAEMLGDWVY